MIIINIIILLVLSISIFVFPKIKNKLQLNIFTSLQIFLITLIFTMGSYFIEILGDSIDNKNWLIVVALLLSLIIGVSNNKYYKKFGVK